MKFMNFVLAGLTVLCDAVTDGAASGAAVVELTAEQVAEQAKAFVAAELAKASEALQQAVAEGHILALRGEVVITDKASPTKKGTSGFYLQLEAQDAQGQMLMCNGKLAPATPKPEGEDTRTKEQAAPGACDFFNYGYDLDVRSKVRAKLMSGLEGPEKAIAASVKNCVTNLGMSEADAREFVINQRKKAGLPV